jgi:DNA-binding MarR family transcriptional regulator
MPLEGAAPPELRAIRAWVRLEQAVDAFNRDLVRRHRVTGAQLAMLRIVAEQPLTLADLRSRLVMHPATIGQLIDRMQRQGLVERSVSADDRRKRVVAPTARGRELLAAAPLAGPVRLRQAPPPIPERSERLAAALEDAIDLFGLKEWST